MSFAKEFAKESEAAILAAEEVVKVTAISLFTGIINASPVGNSSLWKSKYTPDGYVGGTYRSNHFLSLGSPSNKVTSNRSEKSKRIKEVLQIATMPYNSSYWLTNNLPYAERIEAGHSTQAPLGVYAPQEALVNSKIKRFEKAANIKYGVE